MTQARVLAQQGNVPCFNAYLIGAPQACSTGAITKVNLDAVQFDTNGYWDSTNKRYTPQIAGYYQFDFCVYNAATVNTAVLTSILLFNGGQYKYGSQLHASTTKTIGSSGACIIQLNGSTDYIELSVYQDTGSSQNISNAFASTYLSGFLIRAT